MGRVELSVLRAVCFLGLSLELLLLCCGGGVFMNLEWSRNAPLRIVKGTGRSRDEMCPGAIYLSELKSLGRRAKRIYYSYFSQDC